MERELVGLRDGSPHRFSQFATLGAVVPASGAGVYAIWDDYGGLVYVGITGRNPDGRGVASRLQSHASGRRSGDQFCVYVADHYVLPALTPQQIADIRDRIHEDFSFRFVTVADYSSAIAIENAVKDGALGQPPRLNPARGRRAEPRP